MYLVGQRQPSDLNESALSNQIKFIKLIINIISLQLVIVYSSSSSQVDWKLNTPNQIDLLVIGSVTNVVIVERDHITRVVHKPVPLRNLEKRN